MHRIIEGGTGRRTVVVGVRGLVHQESEGVSGLVSLSARPE